MIEYLKQLIADEEWKRALDYVERLTANQDLTLQEMVVVYRSSLRARLKLGDYSGAIAAGELAVQLAQEVADWDSYGTACNDIGVAHFMTKQYEEAAFYFSKYLSSTHLFAPPPEMLTLVWYNIGCAYRDAKKSAEAVAALTEALRHASSTGDALSMQSVRLVLVGVKLRAGQLDQLPRLLAQSAHYTRKYPFHTHRALYLLLYRIEFARLTGRLRRARSLAVKGLQASDDNPSMQFRFHMRLAMIQQEAGCPTLALEHALAARAYSVASGRPYLEAEASDFVDRLVTAHGLMVT